MTCFNTATTVEPCPTPGALKTVVEKGHMVNLLVCTHLKLKHGFKWVVHVGLDLTFLSIDLKKKAVWRQNGRLKEGYAII